MPLIGLVVSAMQWLTLQLLGICCPRDLLPSWRVPSLWSGGRLLHHPAAGLHALPALSLAAAAGAAPGSWRRAFLRLICACGLPGLFGLVCGLYRRPGWRSVSSLGHGLLMVLLALLASRSCCDSVVAPGAMPASGHQPPLPRAQRRPVPAGGLCPGAVPEGFLVGGAGRSAG